MKRVLITGAKGAVGRQVVNTLLSLQLKNKNSSENMELIATDLPVNLAQMGPLEIEKLTSDVSHIIHTAAIVDISTPWEKLKTINVDVTARLARKAFEQKAFFLFISSGSIYKGKDSVIKEDDELEPTSPYERSKVEAEEAIHRIAKNYGGRYAIIRPALIYGPKCRFLGASLAALPSLMNSVIGKNVIGFSGGPKTNWVHCEDVARAVVHLCENKIEGIFNVADDTRCGFGDATTAHLEGYGLNVIAKIALPSASVLRVGKRIGSQPFIWDMINTPVSFIWDLFRTTQNLKKDLDVQVNKEMSPYLFNDTIFDNLKLKNTGFQFKYPTMAHGIKNTMDWYKRNNWIR